MSLALNVMQHFIITATINKIENLHCEKIVKILNMVLVQILIISTIFLQCKFSIFYIVGVIKK